MKTILLILLNLQLIYGATFNSTGSVYDRGCDVPDSGYQVDSTSYIFGYPQNTYVNHQSTFGYIDDDSEETQTTVLTGDPSFFIILGLLFLWMTHDIIIHPMIEKDKK